MSDDELSVALLESLQRANPVSIDEVENRRDLPSAHALFAEITAQRPRRLRRRTVVVVIALVVLALVALVGAFALVNRSEPAAAVGPLCFESQNIESHAIVAGVGPDLRASCAALWQAGDFGTGPIPKSFDVCVLPGGAPGVFPGEAGNVCAGLGLPEARTSTTDERIANVVEQAKDAFGGPGNCVGYDDARAAMTRILEKNGLDGWTVGLEPDALPFSDANPCSAISVSASQRTVFLVPGPPVEFVSGPTG